MTKIILESGVDRLIGSIIKHGDIEAVVTGWAKTEEPKRLSVAPALFALMAARPKTQCVSKYTTAEATAEATGPPNSRPMMSAHTQSGILADSLLPAGLAVGEDRDFQNQK